MTDDTFVLLAQDFFTNSPHAPKFKPQNPDELALLEFHTEEMTSSGIVLLPVTTLKPGQMNILPKWKVVAVGDNVEKETGVKAGDLILISRYAGRIAVLDHADFRIINYREILGKVTMEPMKDFRGLIERLTREAEEKRRQRTEVINA
jgi:co-chaperonin GroES (HSP10)